MTLVSPGGKTFASDVNYLADRTIDKPIGRALASATQSFTNNITTAVAFGAEDYDTALAHDVAVNNSRITVPAGYAGYWTFEGTLLFGVRSDYQVVDSWWRKGGSINIPPGGRRSETTGSVSSFQAVHAKCTIFMDPALGDYVELMGVQTNVAAAAQVTAFAAQHISVAEWRFEHR
jgi:hypothetical protein